MRSIRIISKVLRAAAVILAWVYGLSFSYSVLVLLLHALFPNAGWVPVEDDGVRFVILFPFTETGFITERSHWQFQLFVLAILSAYAVFFYLLNQLFAAFSGEKAFSDTAVKVLSRFSKANLAVPPLIFLYYAAITNDAGMGEALLAMAHLLLGVFTLFLAVIFREGYHLQQEQDLTI